MNTEASSHIYRYKFSEDFVTVLSNFSKIHQYDDRKTYHESWKNWLEENAHIVNKEISRLQSLGYIGDIKNKMYKSSRYYFRTKPITKEEPVKRRQYISIDRDVLSAMDDHIITNMRNLTFTPSDGYNLFCQNNLDVLKDEILRMHETGFSNEEITNKVKKTYKNRYFIISRNNNIITND